MNTTLPSLRSLRYSLGVLALALLTGASTPAQAQTSAAAEPVPLSGLKVSSYMGRWYQVAWFPNRFQKQCVSDTSATYRQLPDGNVEVTNRCRQADGKFDSVVGLARPSGSVLQGDQLEPAKLEVSFLPSWLRWLPIWGSYWVLQLADDGRYAVVGDPTRQYVWVLSRTPGLAAADETAIRSRLLETGFDLSSWQNHPHGPVTPTAP